MRNYYYLCLLFLCERASLQHLLEQEGGVLVMGCARRNLIRIGYVVGQGYLKAIVVYSVRIFVGHLAQLKVVGSYHSRHVLVIDMLQEEARAVELIGRVGAFQYLV